MTDSFFADRFHFCALLAGQIAYSEGRLQEREYVRRLAYRLFEQGAFRERARDGPHGGS